MADRKEEDNLEGSIDTSSDPTLVLVLCHVVRSGGCLRNANVIVLSHSLQSSVSSPSLLSELIFNHNSLSTRKSLPLNIPGQSINECKGGRGFRKSSCWNFLCKLGIEGPTNAGDSFITQFLMLVGVDVMVKVNWQENK